HIAQIDADAKLDALICRDFGIALARGALDRHRASDRFDDTRELDQDAVAGRLDDPTLVPGNLRVDQFAPQRPEPRQGAGLVLAHQPAVPRYITREDGRQSALDPLCGHGASLPEFTLRRYRWPINRDKPARPLRELRLCAICAISY